jgi:hypothetical protein
MNVVPINCKTGAKSNQSLVCSWRNIDDSEKIRLFKKVHQKICQKKMSQMINSVNELESILCFFVLGNHWDASIVD